MSNVAGSRNLGTKQSAMRHILASAMLTLQRHDMYMANAYATVLMLYDPCPSILPLCAASGHLKQISKGTTKDKV